MQLGGARPTGNRIYVVDRDQLTSDGGTSVVHLAAYVIEREMGRASAVKALRIMIEHQPLPPAAMRFSGQRTFLPHR